MTSTSFDRLLRSSRLAMPAIGESEFIVDRSIKQAVTRIPVLGNGDIWEAEDALRMLRQTGCDGVIVGRGCLGRPWLFRDLADVFCTLAEGVKGKRAVVMAASRGLGYASALGLAREMGHFSEVGDARLGSRRRSSFGGVQCREDRCLVEEFLDERGWRQSRAVVVKAAQQLESAAHFAGWVVGIDRGNSGAEDRKLASRETPLRNRPIGDAEERRAQGGHQTRGVRGVVDGAQDRVGLDHFRSDEERSSAVDHERNPGTLERLFDKAAASPARRTDYQNAVGLLR